MSRYNKGNLASRSIRLEHGSEHGSALLEFTVIFAVVMLLVFIPLTTQVLPRYQKGNVTINLYESYNAYSVPQNHFTNLNPEGHLVPADLSAEVDPGLRSVAIDLTNLTKLADFCGIMLKNSQTGPHSRATDLLTSQDENGNGCATRHSIPQEIIDDFEAQVIPDDGVAFGATVYHVDPTDNSLTYAHLRLSPGVENQ